VSAAGVASRGPKQPGPGPFPTAAACSPRGWYGRNHNRVLLPQVLDLTDFKRDLSELTDRLGHAQDCL
jgi:peptide chain release factor 2